MKLTFESNARDGTSLPTLYKPPPDAFPKKRIFCQSNDCAIYTRFSDDVQNINSTARQKEISDSYGITSGLRCVAVYSDEGITGTTDDREALKKLLEDAKNGRFKHVIVECLDRAARDLEVAVHIYKQLTLHGVTLHDVEEGRALSLADIGRKGATAQGQKDLIVARSVDGKRRKAKEGHFGGFNCFGYEKWYDNVTRTVKVRINELEAGLIRQAYEWKASGISSQVICELMNALPKDQRGNKDWTVEWLDGSQRQKTGMLRNPRYVCLRVHGKLKDNSKNPTAKTRWELHPENQWIVADMDPALRIISDDLSNRVQLVFQERSDAYAERSSKFARTTKKFTPLRGLVRCKCGNVMHPDFRASGSARLRCGARDIGSDGTFLPEHPSISLDDVEEEVRKQIDANLNSATGLKPYIQTYVTAREREVSELDDEKNKLRRSRTTLEHKLDDLRADERSGYPESYIAGRKELLFDEFKKLEAHEGQFKAKLVKAERCVDFEATINRHLELFSSLDDLFDKNFVADSAKGATLIAAWRGFIHSVSLEVDDVGCNITLKCRVADDSNDDESNLVAFRSRIGRRVRGANKYLSRPRDVRRAAIMAEKGEHSVSDEEWRQIAYLIPEKTTVSKDGVRVNPRNVLNAILLHLWEKVPMNCMPEIFGPPEAVQAAANRLTGSGTWNAIAAVLKKIAPERLPQSNASSYFPTDPTQFASRLKAKSGRLETVRAQHGIEAASGKHEPTDEIWSRVSNFIPVDLLQIEGVDHAIDPRVYLHGLLYWSKERIPQNCLPLMFGSRSHFAMILYRLANSGHLDKLVSELLEMSPSPLLGADLRLLDTSYILRSGPQAIWRPTSAKRIEQNAIPPHFPSDDLWILVEHLFPPHLLLVDGKTALKSPRTFAHAVLYRIKEAKSFSTIPNYFGDPKLIQRVADRWVYGRLWDQFRELARLHAPELLAGADLDVFDSYKRGKRLPLCPPLLKTQSMPPHEPSDDDFRLIEDLVPLELLMRGGRPAIMEPKKFFHAIVYILKSRTRGQLLPEYFGSQYELRRVIERFVRLHLWDAMRTRIEVHSPEWTKDANLTLFDNLPRSKNPNARLIVRGPQKK